MSSPAGAFNLRSEQFTLMPTARTPFGLAELSPGLTDNTPNNNQVTIGGAFAYDNVFLMDGVDINDNVLGQPNGLFIEDAIEEVQVLRSGVPAEYGRFGGGIVNVITRSGSNLFAGGLRSNFTNPAWSVETPLEKSAGTTRTSPDLNTDLARRDYQAIDFQGEYRFGGSLSVNGLWTVQLENDGNFEGESANNPAIPSLIGDYPEVYVAERSFPMGRLDDFQRHKVRVWANYSFDLHEFGRLDVSPLYRYNSPRTFSLVAPAVALTPDQAAFNPGYVRLPSSQPVFFGARGSQEFADYALIDLAVTYGVPVWQSVRPWVKLEVLNLFNNQQLIAWDTTVAADLNGPKDANGLPLNYITGPNFGKATSNASFARPRQGMDGGRTFILAAGIKF